MEGRFRGRRDIPLDEEGIRQAKRIGERIKGLVEKVYTSPVERARRTAEIIGEVLGVEVEDFEPFIDVDYGEWEGLLPKEVEERYPELFGKWVRGELSLVFPGGEGLWEVSERAFRGLEELSERHSGNIAIVSHNVVIRLVISRVLGLGDGGIWKIDQEPGAINILKKRGDGFCVVLMNEICHIR